MRTAQIDDGGAAHAHITTTNVTKTVGRGPHARVLLDEISADFADGTLTAILGSSGSGKTTFFNLISGVDRPTSGSIHIGSTDISTLTVGGLAQLRRTQVGYIYQDYHLLDHLTVEENITLPLQLARRPLDQQWYSTLVQLLGLDDIAHLFPREISRAECQLAALARAALGRPGVILADDPTQHLDVITAPRVLEVLRLCAHEFGETVLIGTRDPFAASYADRVLLFHRGHLAGEVTHPSEQAIRLAMEALREQP